MAKYTLTQAGDPAAERQRLALVQQCFDRWTIANLTRLGVAPGWQCLDVGGGWRLDRTGGAQSIVVGQREGGSVEVYSSGNGLRGAPTIYMKDPQMHDYDVSFSPIARFSPFGSKAGITVGPTATTEGADVLVSGRSGATSVEVVKYAMARPSHTATTLRPKRLNVVSTTSGTQAQPLAGN